MGFCCFQNAQRIWDLCTNIPSTKIDRAQVERLAVSPLIFLRKLQEGASTARPSAVNFLVDFSEDALLEQLPDSTNTSSYDWLRDALHLFVQLWDLGCINFAWHSVAVAGYVVEDIENFCSYKLPPTTAVQDFCFIAHESSFVSESGFSESAPFVQLIAGPELEFLDDTNDLGLKSCSDPMGYASLG
ncbi:hypothetical protein CPB83DRAFT_893549 [Crepidotus variabilis]|uniref:Uncharacterized protein n=1 Tax=Crepidotus variabilis TaxID=179855 RepID=A0A9P6JR76_9AGAR|nr:hypothetical protein CPB83DRAFT_893549 [Crepidotus variabilis]